MKSALRGAGAGPILSARAPRGRARRAGGHLLAAAFGLALAAAADPASAQVARDIQESRQRLEQIRAERERLQAEMRELNNQVQSAARRVANIEGQVDVSVAALREMDFQTAALATGAEDRAGELTRTRDQLKDRKVVLHRRLRTIYMRGPLHTARVLLGAQSFGDLLTRYKYLQQIALAEQLLVGEVASLEEELVEQERELRLSLRELERLRTDKIAEVARLERLEGQAQSALQGVRRREQDTRSRLSVLEEDERRLADAIAELERRRLEAERRAAIAGGAEGSGSLDRSDLGSLAWPVDGTIAYRFGPERRPNGVVLRWNGVGIGAPAGAPVRAVEEGTVVHAGPFEGYGPSVWISHGGGYYTLYLYLRSLAVRSGERVAKGQLVGTVGGEGTPEGAHIEFQVRVPVRGGVPEAVDPLAWLSERR
ncbi:MAG TPA: peptidoglycan DD-metalloendopeptidase family protein [Planctomycetota bacterium]|nr:peptidoglycan DD-metalloendopeptidase family protein [Planctomycetota bacterium]